ncbi:MAG: hypothetical protein ACT4OE_06725 [Sphingosinicella sp.]
MESVLIALAVAAAPLNPTGEGAAAASLDQLCYRAMAQLAEHDDPRVRTTGRIAAQYFRGRLDASATSGNASNLAANWPALLARCGELLRDRGHDLRSLGDALAPPTPEA